MWKQLHSNQHVHLGDKVKYAGNTSFINSETIFQVVKTEQYYFVVKPVASDGSITVGRLSGRIIKYFDIGHYIGVEVWTETT